MIDLKQVHEMWQKDCVIDNYQLDETSRQTPILHSKYIQLWSTAKLEFKRAEFEQKKLLKDKWLYYNGKMSQQDMDNRKWKYDPFDGMTKPLKSDMDMYYSIDEDMVRIRAQIDYQKTIIDTLEEIMGNIRWRHTHVKNILDFKKFTSGM